MEKQDQLPFAAYVGIDWADKKHDFCIEIPAEGTQEFDVSISSVFRLMLYATRRRDKTTAMVAIISASTVRLLADNSRCRTQYLFRISLIRAISNVKIGNRLGIHGDVYERQFVAMLQWPLCVVMRHRAYHNPNSR